MSSPSFVSKALKSDRVIHKCGTARSLGKLRVRFLSTWRACGRLRGAHVERRSHLNQRIRVLGADPAHAPESRLSCFPLSGGPGGSGQPSPPRRVAGAVGDSLAGGPRVSCDSAAGPLPPAAAGPFPERRGGGGRRGATIGARARGCGRDSLQGQAGGRRRGAGLEPPRPRAALRTPRWELPLRAGRRSAGDARGPGASSPAARGEVGLPGRRASGPQLRGPRSAPDSPIAGSVATCLWRSRPRGSGAKGRSRPPPSRR